MPARRAISWSRENSLSLAAVFIAGCALFLSVCENRSNRQHMRLSVRPELRISTFDTAKGAGWRMTNVGLGPARVRWFQVYVDDKAVPNWAAMAEELSAQGYTVVYAADKSGWLFHVTAPSADRLVEQSTRVRMEICYCSIYNECWLNANHYSATDWGPAPRPTTCNDHPDERFDARLFPNGSVPAPATP